MTMFTGTVNGAWDTPPSDPVFGSWYGDYDSAGVIYTGTFYSPTGVTLFDGKVTSLPDGRFLYDGIWAL